MNHKQKLLEIYHSYFLVEKNTSIPEKQQHFLNVIGENIRTQKGVFTVLVTLITHKILHAEQDIRFHQSSMEGGFSGRSIDYQYITPTLKELGLPSMAESGWLTRSLEQPFPYTLDYGGKISNKIVKEAFLNIIDFVEKQPAKSEEILRIILGLAIEASKLSQIEIKPLANPESITISKIIDALEKHFNFHYKTHGGSKLPVLAFYAIYQSLISELKRYDTCTLEKLGSHTASDRTSKAAGDIQIFKEGKLFESIEIKLDKEIDVTMVRIAIEKIHKHSPNRYYILSIKNVKSEDKVEIEKLIAHLKMTHGCQLVINGVLPSLKYYLRLLDNIQDFVRSYSKLIEKDTELQDLHKLQWNSILADLT
jgi:DNA (cytosine-5)-methyltransferase 1